MNNFIEQLNNWLNKARPGLVPKKVMVHRESKIFPSTRWVRPTENVSLGGVRIPPAWKDVYISRDPHSALQVVGKDAAGRLQHLYSKEHSEKAAAKKFKRLKDFTKELPKLIKKISEDIRNKDEALILYLIYKTGFRIGSDIDTHAAKKAYGASTLEKKHIKINGDKISFDFMGKKGVSQKKEIKDTLLAKLLGEKLKTASDKLFDVDYNDVHQYLQDITNKPFKIKDFRTYLGTSLAIEAMKKQPMPVSMKEFKKSRKAVAEEVAKELGNTPAMALSAYIQPEIFGVWQSNLQPGELQKSDNNIDNFIDSIVYEDENESWESSEETGFDPDEEDNYNGCDECDEDCHCIEDNGCQCEHNCICPDLQLSGDNKDSFLDLSSLLEKATFWNEENDLSLIKATISTPMKEGQFNPDAVKIGDSVWITVNSLESPLHGRHILIVKRPDHTFAIAGGAGPDVSARRHLVLTGTPRKTKRDIELTEEAEEAEKYNEPIIMAKKELEAEARQEIKISADKMLSALGIEKVSSAKDLIKQKEEIQEYIHSAADIETDQAKKFTDVILRQYTNANRKVAEKVQRERQLIIAKIGQRLTQIKEGSGIDDLIQSANQEAPIPQSIPLPDVSILQGLTPEQQESVVANHFDSFANSFFDGNERPDSIETKGPQVILGENIKPLEIKSKEDLIGAINHVQDYWKKRGEAEQQAREIKRVPLTASAPSTIAALREQIKAAGVEITPEELEAYTQKNYDQWMGTNTALALYDAVADFWNDDKSLVDTLKNSDKADTTMKFHIESGAATAIAAMAKEHLGVSLDTKKLIDKANLEVASAALALAVRNKYIPSTGKQDVAGFDAIVEKVKNFNASNQIDTEKVALTRHKQLSSQYDLIRQQKESGELLDKIRISNFEMQNLLEQRKNLGSALGSLQSSATFYDSLVKMRSAKNDMVSINVGNSKEDAESLVDRLRLQSNTKKRYDIDESDPDNIIVKIGLTSLDKFITDEKDNQAKHDTYEKIKTDMSGISEDDQGNLVADKYDVPYWKSTWTDEGGVVHPYKWRVEQRNDINWLLETTKKTSDNPEGNGGGLVTRTVGAGKTNTALGFFANKLSENKEYKGLVVVPKGRAEQWYAEAKKFTDLPIEIIPDGTAKDKIDDILLKSKPGTIYMMGHREAARSSEMLTQLQANSELKAKFNGLVIDEPQELQARGQSGNIGALGKRIMRLPVAHRVGLTATPARRNPLESYDLIKWTSQTKDIGAKASFNRIFSGFGSGTNAQDTAIRKLYFETIQPYISGDRIQHPTFKVTHDNIGMKRTPIQIARQKEIETNSAAYIERRKAEIRGEIENNPNHSFRRTLNWNSPPVMAKYTTTRARKEVEDQHNENMDGGDYQNNAKMLSLKDNLAKDPDKKHVIFIDSRFQRNAINGIFKDMGLKPQQIKNIAATTTSITGEEMARRARDFQKNPQVKYLVMDKAASVGFNLQAGNSLHIVGTPQDASTFLQTQGRIARMPRKGDVNIQTYRYDDNVVEQQKWNDLDAQLKLLRATSPALFPKEK